MKARTRRSHAVWLSLIQQQIESGITAAEFCRQHNINDKYFSKRKRELHGERDAFVSGNRFIKAQAVHQADAVSSASLVLRHRNTQLHIPVGADLRVLAQLMMLLS
jgi:hypothetical protein